MTSVKIVNVVTPNQNLQEELEYLTLQTRWDWNKVKGRKKIAEGILAISKMTKYEMLSLPAENVPLYCFPSTRKQIVNGRAKQIVEEVNSLSWAVLMAHNSIDTMVRIKTHSTTDLKMYIEYVTTAITFGTLKMTRITIPKVFPDKSIIHDQQLSEN